MNIGSQKIASIECTVCGQKIVDTLPSNLPIWPKAPGHQIVGLSSGVFSETFVCFRPCGNSNSLGKSPFLVQQRCAPVYKSNPKKT